MHDHQLGCAVYTREVGSSSDNDDAGSTVGTQWIICRGLLKIQWFTNTGDANREWRWTNRSCSSGASKKANFPCYVATGYDTFGFVFDSSNNDYKLLHEACEGYYYAYIYSQRFNV
ncbi:hypothetical protein Tco_0556638 [Tanacetum coccineum]